MVAVNLGRHAMNQVLLLSRGSSRDVRNEVAGKVLIGLFASWTRPWTGQPYINDGQPSSKNVVLRTLHN
uniref:Uncharacterized protein n=1 Tax=Steinernema glaseri TaxID=37863 RepID=A0A1I7Y347_9BILA